jgi:hypothetical protein
VTGDKWRALRRSGALEQKAKESNTSGAEVYLKT